MPLTGEGPEKRNSFLHKVTFDFDTKETKQNKTKTVYYTLHDPDWSPERQRPERERREEGRCSDSLFSLKQHFKKRKEPKGRESYFCVGP